MLITTILGARPQFVKAAVISRILHKYVGIQETIIHTGQHYDENLSDVFFKEMGIPSPTYRLCVGSGTHAEQTGRMLEAIERVLMSQKPDIVMVYGDTNTTVAGALAAAKIHIPVVHVESGLRSFNKQMPEEINRVVTDHLSDVLFAPTEESVRNLRREGISEGAIYLTGDVMYDASLFYADMALGKSEILGRLGLAEREYILATIHRAENTSDTNRLAMIFEALGYASKDTKVVCPLHPRTRYVMERCGLLARIPQTLHLIEPVGYLDMIVLEKGASLVVTDSGGVQKEAFFFRVPCVTLREETEWVELVDMGWNTLVPPLSVERILLGIRQSIGTVGREGAPYGDGHAGELMVETLWRRYGCGS